MLLCLLRAVIADKLMFCFTGIFRKFILYVTISVFLLVIPGVGVSGRHEKLVSPQSAAVPGPPESSHPLPPEPLPKSDTTSSHSIDSQSQLQRLHGMLCFIDITHTSPVIQIFLITSNYLFLTV